MAVKVTYAYANQSHKISAQKYVAERNAFTTLFLSTVDYTLPREKKQLYKVCDDGSLPENDDFFSNRLEAPTIAG